MVSKILVTYIVMEISGFHLSHLDSHAPLQTILSSSLKSLGVFPITPVPDILFWDAGYLGLDQVQLFQESDFETQSQILHIANRDLLEEIYWVEHAGIGYMAKMLLLSQTCEERRLYSLFVADEATHLAQIRPFLGQDPVFQGDTFLEFMSQVLESSDPALLMTMIQVVLEGWGLSHYRSLAKDCLYSPLTKVLRGFLDAESRHHATGVKQLQGFEYSSASLESIHAALTHFLQMVQVGSQRLIAAIAEVKGDLSVVNKIQILTELQTEVHSHTRLQLLQSLIKGVVPNSILQSLEDQGSFQPYPANRCIL